MGSESTKAIEARRRGASARAGRLIADAEKRSSIAAARRARTHSATRDGLRALKALAVAERALVDLQERVEAALVLLTECGLSRNQAYKSLGLSRAVGRRLINLSASTRRAAEVLSTDASIGPGAGAARGDGETSSPNGATTKGIL